MRPRWASHRGVSTEVKLRYTTDREREEERKREYGKRMTADETWRRGRRAYTRSQRACPRQRGEHDDAHSSFVRLPGSQGGSSSTLSQSDSTRDLVRYTLTPCSRVHLVSAPYDPPSQSYLPPFLSRRPLKPSDRFRLRQLKRRDDRVCVRKRLTSASSWRSPYAPTGPCPVASTSLLTESRRLAISLCSL